MKHAYFNQLDAAYSSLQRTLLNYDNGLSHHSTHSYLKYSLRRLVTFSETYGVPTLLDTPLLHPPASPVISILWTVSHYTLQQSKRTKNNIT
jgi:hypothetical protein